MGADRIPSATVRRQTYTTGRGEGSRRLCRRARTQLSKRTAVVLPPESTTPTRSPGAGL
jgi:hypothetical protein